ncbi:MAG: hypothetical protein HY343_11880 [Lentisphaerae bacterium]|nr:hypothetical protein [Lentisphaerota bacterium]
MKKLRRTTPATQWPLFGLLFGKVLPAAGLAVVAAFFPLAAQCQTRGEPGKIDDRFGPVAEGQRVFTCGHSFHVFSVAILTDMAKAAGITNHVVVGVSSIGGSRVIQHWKVPENGNRAKTALRSGKVDVLTLSPIWLPDEGIGNFVKLAVEHNPNVRVTVQAYWLPNDTYEPIYPLQTGRKVDHNATDLAVLRQQHERYFHDVDEYVRDVNKQLGKPSVLIVPAGQAVLALRDRIADGQAFGLKTQAELFSDSWGHPMAPVQVLATYCHFAVIYRRSPVGLPLPHVMAASKNPNWDDKLNRLLQELAWEAVTHHSLSGVRPLIP